jgi:hypothetical protein
MIQNQYFKNIILLVSSINRLLGVIYIISNITFYRKIAFSLFIRKYKIIKNKYENISK